MATNAFTSLSSHSRSIIQDTRHAVTVPEYKAGPGGGEGHTGALTRPAPGRGGPPGAPGPRPAGGGCGSWPWPGCAAGAGSPAARRRTCRRLPAPGPQTGRAAAREDTPPRPGLGREGALLVRGTPLGPEATSTPEGLSVFQSAKSNRLATARSPGKRPCLM